VNFFTYLCYSLKEKYMTHPNEFQYDAAPAKQFIQSGKLFLHELQFIAKKKGIPNYLEMSYEELSDAILKHKKEIKKDL